MRRTGVVAAVALVAMVAALGGWRLAGGSGGRSAAAPLPDPAASPPTRGPGTVPAPTTTATTEATVADPGGSRLRVGTAHPVTSPALVADAVGPSVALYSAPGDDEPGDVMANPTWEGLPVVFLVMAQQGDWVQVQVSRRPNEATAWVKAADVTLRSDPYMITVDSSAHRLTLTDGTTTLLDVPVAVGTGGTPTPTGTFFLDGAARPPDPGGPYGAYELSVAAFSDVLTSFGGGNGQIAIHGTNAPGLVGSAVSHGCVRMTNADVTTVATTVPVGTPVEIR
ncbi:MAG: L,D-transpeptidase [Acidimicrobiales bacterium]